MESRDSLWSFFRRSASPIKLRLVLITISAVLVVVTSVYLIGRILHINLTAPTEVPATSTTNQTADPAPDSPAYPFELRNLSLPLAERKSSRMHYAQFTLVLECPTPESRRLMELSRAKLLDTILEVGAAFHAEDFQGPNGYEAFKGALKANLSYLFKENAPQDVFIKDWLMN